MKTAVGKKEILTSSGKENTDREVWLETSMAYAVTESNALWMEINKHNEKEMPLYDIPMENIASLVKVERL